MSAFLAWEQAMKRLPYLAALLLMPLLIVASSARAQDAAAEEEAEGSTSTLIVLSGNGRTVTNSFDLESGLAILVVCVASGNATTSEDTDTGPEADAGELVARAGGAEARVGEDGAVARAGGVVARAGGATARSGDGNDASSQATFSSQQTNNRVDIECTVTGQGEASCTDQGDAECIEEEETKLGGSDVDVSLLHEDGEQVGDDLANRTDSPVASSRAVRTKGGRHVLDVRAKGPWTVKIEQPRPSSAPRTTRFSGDHEAVTDFFRLRKGPKSFEMIHSGKGKFSVQLLDKDGTKVGGSLVNEEGSFRGSKSLRVPEDGIYLLQVEANGPWAIRLR